MENLSSELKMKLSESSHYSIFDDILNNEERKYMLRHGEVYNADSGTVLCHQDRISNDLFFILQGGVKITKKSDEKEIELGFLSVGDIFGEISALLSAPRIATVAANKPSLILEMKKDDFINLLEFAPNLKQLVYKQLSKRNLQTSIQTQQASYN